MTFHFFKNYLNVFAFSRRLFVTTDTELKAMAAAANIGFSRKPVKGYSTPAAIGIPVTL